MPELPDVILYVDSLSHLFASRELRKVIIKSPFVLRTFEPPIESIEGRIVEQFSRVGKRIVWHFENRYCLVFHLMITGRFHWKSNKIRLPTSKTELAAFQFDHGTMMLTEASSKKRAAMHLVKSDQELSQFARGGLDVLTCSREQFQSRLALQNRTLKRALTDPSIFDGIGNAYSDEILLEAGLSPLRRTSQLSPQQIESLFEATQSILAQWINRLQEQNTGQFPEKVTAFRPEMMAHGKFQQPCPKCKTPIQRIRYAENECNYCPRCQTGGKMLADRSLSRLLKDDWPKTIEELEG